MMSGWYFINPFATSLPQTEINDQIRTELHATIETILNKQYKFNIWENDEESGQEIQTKFGH
jgi:hypothetical protein